MFSGIRPHSIELFDTLRKAPSLIGESAAIIISDYIFSQFTADGGFRNRAGKCDQYYTMFGLTCAEALGVHVDIGLVSRYLSRFIPAELDLVHLVCWSKSKLIIKLSESIMPYNLLAVLYCLGFKTRVDVGPERFRAPDGGFCEDVNSGKSHPYAIFMGVNLYQDCGLQMPEVGKAVIALENCRTEQGAYHNPGGGGRGMLLSTCAAVLALRQLTGKVDAAALQWLSGQQGDTGGFHASPDSPMPDLLSTGVALYTLKICGYPLNLMSDKAKNFIIDHWHENGGFTGALVDECTDCEYTFYALMALGALADD